jgi:hypothetical protein
MLVWICDSARSCRREPLTDLGCCSTKPQPIQHAIEARYCHGRKYHHNAKNHYQFKNSIAASLHERSGCSMRGRFMKLLLYAKEAFEIL